MTERDVTPPPEDPDEDRGLPFFWGFLLVVAVVVIAVALFNQIDLGAG